MAVLEKNLREAIERIVQENLQRKVRNVWYIGKMADSRDIYGVSGNNNKLICNCIVSCNGGIEVIL